MEVGIHSTVPQYCLDPCSFCGLCVWVMVRCLVLWDGWFWVAVGGGVFVHWACVGSVSRLHFPGGGCECCVGQAAGAGSGGGLMLVVVCFFVCCWPAGWWSVGILSLLWVVVVGLGSYWVFGVFSSWRSMVLWVLLVGLSKPLSNGVQCVSS